MDIKTLLYDLTKFESNMKNKVAQRELVRVEQAHNLGLCSDGYHRGFDKGIRDRSNGLVFDKTYQQWSGSGDVELGYNEGYRGVVDWSDLRSALRSIRRWRGWSTSDLGLILGRSGRSIESWEQGANQIPKYVLHALILIYYNY
jgi:hypothetical protein